MAKKIIKALPFDQHLQQVVVRKESELKSLYSEYEEKKHTHYVIENEDSLWKKAKEKHFDSHEFLQHRIELLNLKINCLLNVI